MDQASIMSPKRRQFVVNRAERQQDPSVVHIEHRALIKIGPGRINEIND